MNQTVFFTLHAHSGKLWSGSQDCNVNLIMKFLKYQLGVKLTLAITIQCTAHTSDMSIELVTFAPTWIVCIGMSVHNSCGTVCNLVWFLFLISVSEVPEQDDGIIQSDTASESSGEVPINVILNAVFAPMTHNNNNNDMIEALYYTYLQF